MNDLRTAADLFAAGDVTGAKNIFLNILERDKINVDALHNVATCLARLGKAEQALQYYERAIQVNPKFKKSWISYLTLLMLLGKFDVAQVQFTRLNEEISILGELQEFVFLKKDFDTVEVKLDIKKITLGRDVFQRFLNHIYKKNDLLYALRLLNFWEHTSGEVQKEIYSAITAKIVNRTDTTKLSELNKQLKQGRPNKTHLKVASLLTTDRYNCELQFMAGVTLYQMRKFKDAYHHFENAFLIAPERSSYFSNAGACKNSLSLDREAVSLYRKALDLDPNFADGWCNLSRAQLLDGNPSAAIESIKRAISLNAKNPIYYANLSAAHYKLNNIEEALQSASDGIKCDPSNMVNYQQFAVALKHSKTLALKYHHILVSLGTTHMVERPASFATLASGIIFDEINDKETDIAKDAITFSTLKDLVCRILSSEVARTFLPLTPINNIYLEQLFWKIRSSLLLNRNKLSKIPNCEKFLEIFSQQVWSTDYIYPASTDEHIELEEFHKEITRQPVCEPVLALLLRTYLRENEIINIFNNKVQCKTPFILQICAQSTALNAARTKIVRAGSVSDNVSVLVQEQYEESPYPRWNFLSRPNAILINEIPRSENLKCTIPFDITESKILIAGSGTGQHPIETALRFPNSEVIGIDLSRESLSYAQMKADIYNIKNLKLFQCDILDVDALGMKFDIIESVGVLHHMKNPEKGLQSLRNVLETRGLLKLGLYSSLARKEIVSIQNKISQLNLEDNLSNIVQFRENLITERDPDLFSLAHISDIYNTSMFRDLVFHRQEHRFDIDQLKSLIKGGDCNFCGFSLNPAQRSLFRRSFPADADIFDLSKWQAFEEHFNDFFIGMYKFWVQKLP
jgi:tetratricopeptide (TPR) repeat protein/SAM-dependent methyltransferase